MSSPLVTVFCCSHPSFQPCLGLRLLGLSLYRPSSLQMGRPSLHPHFPAISAPVHSLPLSSASRALTSGVFFFSRVLLASDWHWSPLGTAKSLCPGFFSSPSSSSSVFVFFYEPHALIGPNSCRLSGKRKRDRQQADREERVVPMILLGWQFHICEMGIKPPWPSSKGDMKVR